MNPTLIGLGLNMVGALLLVLFPPTIRGYTRDGAAQGSWVGEPTTRGHRLALIQRVLSRAGLVLLAAGFCVQIYGESPSTRRQQGALRYLACTFTSDKNATNERAFMLAPDGSTFKDGSGDSWEVTVNTPVRIVATYANKLDGQDMGAFMLELNRLNGFATFSRLGQESTKKDGPFPPGVRDVEEEEKGSCSLQTRRVIE